MKTIGRGANIKGAQVDFTWTLNNGAENNYKPFTNQQQLENYLRAAGISKFTIVAKFLLAHPRIGQHLKGVVVVPDGVQLRRLNHLQVVPGSGGGGEADGGWGADEPAAVLPPG